MKIVNETPLYGVEYQIKKEKSMKMFDVYPLYPVELERAEGVWLWDTKGEKYLDLYGGHAVISIGHSHPHYVKRISEQLGKIGFYSNSVHIPLQRELAEKLGELSGLPDYQLFLSNSGAEANENALKLASFVNGRKKIIAFKGSFHGRTSLAVACTDNPSIVAPVNQTENVIFLPFNEEERLEETFAKMGDEISSVILEGIQGVGGIQVATNPFLKKIRELCDKHGAFMIADSVQCGYGRSGKFFAHDYSGVKADIYSMAKGMGNGFPVAGNLIAPHFVAKHGMLGTTFGGNQLSCAAAVAVLDVIKSENLMPNCVKQGAYLFDKLEKIPHVREVRGRGLMIGVEFEFPIADLRNTLVSKYHIFTGNSSNKNTLRILPAMNVQQESLDILLEAIETEVKK